MADLICDTNVYYNIAEQRIDVPALKGQGHRLLLTPVTVLELVSHLTEENFEQRQSAARAALEHADETTLDPECLLAEIWNIPTEPAMTNWSEGLRPLAHARNYSTIAEGVPDYEARVLRRTNVQMVRQWRTAHYDDFARLVIAAIDDFVPGYAASRERGRMRQANRPQREQIEARFSEPEAVSEILRATRERAVLGASGLVAPATNDEISAAFDRLYPYCSIYLRYLYRVATTYAPQPNDFGDLESFIYLSEGRSVATSDDRWIALAVEVGLADRVINPRL